MRSILLGALTFFAFPTALGLLFVLANLSHRPLNKDTTTLDAFILPAYLLLLAMTFATFGFVIVTAAAPVWRRLNPKCAALIAGPLGLTYPVFHLLGLVGGAALLSRLFSNPWLAVVLVHLIPGIVLGLVAILIAMLVQRRPAKTP